MDAPDLSKALHLKELDLSSCKNLISVHPSVFSLPKLVELDMSLCDRLERLPAFHPSVFSLPKLVSLDMRDCKRLESFSDIGMLDIDIGILDKEASRSASALSSSSNLKKLNLRGCVNLKHLPDTFYKLTSLQELQLHGCKELDTSNIHILFDGSSSLTYLDMDGCDKLYELPDNITNLSLLEWLSLEETNVKSMPESIKHLPHLKHLTLRNCKKLESVPQIPPSLHMLFLDDCIMLERVFTPTPQLLQHHLASFQSSNQGSVPHIAYLHGNHVYCTLDNCPNLERDAIDDILKYFDCCDEGMTRL
ncbi:hypothetical protein PIB30_025138 [Stylosanthes scabra]|uniref:Uncharacterized protein n=1 Tax=Stylosanthes scabra TaxID=79078 RepID=A0ABU6W886_9FABA|nr:hypothetical protein [Stylosanthes scabra]